MNPANHFLVTMLDMDDPSFDGSVVYVCGHNKDDALGLIINKPSPVTVGLTLAASDRDIPLRFRDKSVMMGGPIRVDRDYAMHTPIGSW